MRSGRPQPTGERDGLACGRRVLRVPGGVRVGLAEAPPPGRQRHQHARAAPRCRPRRASRSPGRRYGCASSRVGSSRIRPGHRVGMDSSSPHRRAMARRSAGWSELATRRSIASRADCQARIAVVLPEQQARIRLPCRARARSGPWPARARCPTARARDRPRRAGRPPPLRRTGARPLATGSPRVGQARRVPRARRAAPRCSGAPAAPRPRAAARRRSPRSSEPPRRCAMARSRFGMLS